jgi:hypothetical protein
MTLCSVAMPPKCSFFSSLLNVTIDCRNLVKFLPGYQFRFTIFVAAALMISCRTNDIHRINPLNGVQTFKLLVITICMLGCLALHSCHLGGGRRLSSMTCLSHIQMPGLYNPVSFRLQYPRFEAIYHPTCHSRKLWLMLCLIR